MAVGMGVEEGGRLPYGHPLIPAGHRAHSAINPSTQTLPLILPVRYNPEMVPAAAEEKKLYRLAAAVLLASLAIVPAADATRHFPSPLEPMLEPQVAALELVARADRQAPPLELLGFEEHLAFTLGLFRGESELE